MAALRYRASVPERGGLGLVFGILGGVLTFGYVHSGVYVTALPVPRWTVMALIVLLGVLLSALRLRIQDSIAAVLVSLPLSYLAYMTAYMWPQLSAGWALNDLALYFTYGAGGQGVVAWLVTFPVGFVAGFGVHLVGDELRG